MIVKPMASFKSVYCTIAVMFIEEHMSIKAIFLAISICAMVKRRYIGDGHPTFNRNPYNLYIYKTLLLG